MQSLPSILQIMASNLQPKKGRECKTSNVKSLEKTQQEAPQPDKHIHHCAKGENSFKGI